MTLREEVLSEIFDNKAHGSKVYTKTVDELITIAQKLKSLLSGEEDKRRRFEYTILRYLSDIEKNIKQIKRTVQYELRLKRENNLPL
jgi:hypothetical protein